MELVVGRIIRAHGIKGEMVVDVRTDEAETRFAAGAILRTIPTGADAERALTVRSTRRHQGRLLVRFAEVADRAEAARWRGARLVIDVPDDERPEDPEVYYDQQLVGLAVVMQTGEPVGHVTDVLHLPGQELLAVRRDGAEIFIPFVAAIVPEVDLAGGRIIVTPPPGLLDIERAE